VPSGNTTALVVGLETKANKRRLIQDWILRKHPDVEQVGFVSKDASNPQLVMTGGEFCGNATRSAAHYFLGGSPGTISIQASGVEKPLEAGITNTYETWIKMPVNENDDRLSEVGDGLYFVKMEGISHLIVSQRRSFPYLSCNNVDGDKLKQSAEALLKEHGLYGGMACGVIFTENVLDMIKIHPCVFVLTAETAYYETACGSACVAVALLDAVFRHGNVGLQLLQPSGQIINASIEYKNGKISEARIGGTVTMGERLTGGFDVE
jgi:diaminopimelate epimerase